MMKFLIMKDEVFKLFRGGVATRTPTIFSPDYLLVAPYVIQS